MSTRLFSGTLNTCMIKLTSTGYKLKTLEKTCLFCNKLFQADLKEHNRGNARFCSLSCSSKYHQSQKPRPEPNHSCAYCGTSIYKTPARIKTSRNGIFFCNRLCKENAQRLDSDNPVPEIRPPHFGTLDSFDVYRKLMLRRKPLHEWVCEECGFDKHPEIIQVHHKDRDRTNSKIENLQLLCPNCHTWDHYENNDGLYSRKIIK